MYVHIRTNRKCHTSNCSTHLWLLSELDNKLITPVVSFVISIICDNTFCNCIDLWLSFLKNFNSLKNVWIVERLLLHTATVKLWCLPKWWKMKVPVTIIAPNLRLITSINDAPTSRSHSALTTSETFLERIPTIPTCQCQSSAVGLLEKIIRVGKNVINYHLLNPVHTSLNDIDWPRKGREKDNVKIKRAVSVYAICTAFNGVPKNVHQETRHKKPPICKVSGINKVQQTSRTL